jgi:hypothetical protein
MKACWMTNPVDRPNFAQIQKQLNEMTFPFSTDSNNTNNAKAATDQEPSSDNLYSSFNPYHTSSDPHEAEYN